MTLTWVLFYPQEGKKNKKTVNALREVQAVNVHNIPHYIHVISECTPSDAVSNLCDRFRWTLVKGALRGESGLGLTQAASTRSPAGRKEPCSPRSRCLSSPPTLTAKQQPDTIAIFWLRSHMTLCVIFINMNFKLSWEAFAKILTRTWSKGKILECYTGQGQMYFPNLKNILASAHWFGL